MKIHAYLIAIILLPGLSACDRGSEPLDTPTAGTITVAADESFQPLIEAEEYMFEALYTRAHLNISYKSENEVIKALINDSTDLVILSRELNADEKAFFDKIKIIPRTNKIAVDALALIIHKDNKDSALNVSHVLDIVRGKLKNWQDLEHASFSGPIQLVFDQNNSSTVRYMLERAGISDFSGTNTFAARSNKEVIDYIENNRNAIGIIGVNWISDGDDSLSMNFLDRIRVMEIAPEAGQPGAGEFYKPYQGYIAKGFYPFHRSLYVISTEGRSGLGTGFASFLASDRGQRIVMKAGLLPATVPVRLVEINN